MQIIKNILKDNNLNQIQLSKELEISPALLSAIMHSNRGLSKVVMIRLHNKYNIDYETLLGVNANEK
jgi:transcriptional regulator with XRE-family HTH domain